MKPNKQKNVASVTVNQLIRQGREILEAYKKNDAIIDSRLLAMYLLECDQAKLLLVGEECVADHLVQSYLFLIAKRAQGMPLQYITKEQSFMGYDFYVDERVLIPRQDTETLIEVITEYSKNNKLHQGVEIGVGSGCISISLAHEIKDIKLTAIDICNSALEVAQKNIDNHNLTDVITLLESDVFANYKGEVESLDLVVSNPPYITSKECIELMEEVKGYEPRKALTDEGDGLSFYRKITKESLVWLKSGGLLAYEIGCAQGEDVSQMLSECGYENIRVIKDLANRNRVVIGTKK
ncbi:MAG: peptide chain release factor N(5)-glutamine methyltransferase [Cellulosilyticaceae bacterium]